MSEHTCECVIVNGLLSQRVDGCQEDHEPDFPNTTSRPRSSSPSCAALQERLDEMAASKSDAVRHWQTLLRPHVAALQAAKDTADLRIRELEAEPTLKGLAAYLGWGNNMSAAATFAFAKEREQLLRLVQAALDTYKSDAPTAEAALLDRISTLRGEVATIAIERDSIQAAYDDKAAEYGKELTTRMDAQQRAEAAERERDAEQAARLTEVEHWVARYNEVDRWRIATLKRAKAAERKRDELAMSRKNCKCMAHS